MRLRPKAIPVLSLSIVLMAGVAGADNAGSGIALDGNILWNNNGGGSQYDTATFATSCAGVLPNPASTADIAAAFTNVVVNPQLDPNYNNPTAPVYRPLASSPALLENGAYVVDVDDLDDTFFTSTCFVGALDDEAGSDWTTGWTYHNYDGGFGRTDINPAAPVVNVVSNINANTTWTTGNIYVLIGRIAVQPGVTLTIQPGVVVMGGGVGSYLVVERDGFLDAQGTANDPIIMTSGGDFTIGDQFPGDWGGLVLHGKAVANCGGNGAVAGCNLTTTGNDCISEGGAGNFGGNDDSDGSATLRYVRVEYAGQEISPNNELNAFTFNAQGTGTTAEYLQAHLGTDDLFEWFGGVMDGRYWLGTGGADDGLDWQMGFRGRFQFGIIQQVAVADGGQDPDKGIEADNNEFDFDCPGRSNPTIANVTFIGAAGGANGIHLRRGTNGCVFNAIVVDFPSTGLRVQHDESYANCLATSPGAYDCQVTAAPLPVAGFRVAVAPNPVVGQSSFSFNLPAAGNVQVKIYNAAGRVVDTVHDGYMDQGSNLITWSPRQNAAGVYYYSVVSGENLAQGKLLVLE